MKIGSIISIVVAVLAATGLAFVFVKNASPYAQINEAISSPRDMHVAGALVPGTLKRDAASNRLSFELKDETGSMPVEYTGPPKSSLETATQIVVIGKYENGAFAARDMLVKCPSKYESGQTPKS